MKVIQDKPKKSAENETMQIRMTWRDEEKKEKVLAELKREGWRLSRAQYNKYHNWQVFFFFRPILRNSLTTN